jgi:hypothetical protein
MFKLNGAMISLIPKNLAADMPSDFRPICMIHSFAKLVTKVLVMQLSPHTTNLISHSQSAFIKKRCIQHNFLYVRNLTRAYHQKKIPTLLFKLDITKAFDTTSWEYLIDLLQHRGFPVKWRNWLALLLTSSSSAVKLNGARGPWINHQWGLRQGDPLLPFLFILAIDSL